MNSEKAVYGKTKDGRVTKCRAKDPTHCPYHVSDSPHIMLTEKQADEMNERLAADQVTENTPDTISNTTSVPSGKLHKITVDSLGGDSDGSVFNPNDKDWDEFMDRTESLIYTAGLISREIPTSPDKLVERKGLEDLYSTTGSLDQAELMYMENYDHGYPDYRGATLDSSQENAVHEALLRIDDFRSDASNSSGIEDSDVISPIQERLLGTLVDNPHVSDGIADRLSSDPLAMRNGARLLVNSPYIDEKFKDQAFETSPVSALESPELSAKNVDQMFTDDNPYTRAGRRVDETAVLTALHNPNADPKLAYDYVKNHGGSDDEKWKLSLNPNQDFINEIRDLSSKDGSNMIVDHPEGEESNWSAFLE
jgi:hypothetical protein